MAPRNGRNDYPAAVLDALVGEFPHLADAAAADVVEQALVRHVAAPHPAFECIVDDPLLGNWRLRAGRGATSRVRLACYRMSPTPADYNLEQRVNQVLDGWPSFPCPTP